MASKVVTLINEFDPSDIHQFKHNRFSVVDLQQLFQFDSTAPDICVFSEDRQLVYSPNTEGFYLLTHGCIYIVSGEPTVTTFAMKSTDEHAHQTKPPAGQGVNTSEEGIPIATSDELLLTESEGAYILEYTLKMQEIHTYLLNECVPEALPKRLKGNINKSQRKDWKRSVCSPLFSIEFSVDDHASIQGPGSLHFSWEAEESPPH